MLQRSRTQLGAEITGDPLPPRTAPLLQRSRTQLGAEISSKATLCLSHMASFNGAAPSWARRSERDFCAFFSVSSRLQRSRTQLGAEM